MKTIKHLNQETESNEEDQFLCRLTYKQYHDKKIVLEAKIQALKDVLGLIDEIGYDEDCIPFIVRLKARIKGK